MALTAELTALLPSRMPAATPLASARPELRALAMPPSKRAPVETLFAALAAADAPDWIPAENAVAIAAPCARAGAAAAPSDAASCVPALDTCA